MKKTLMIIFLASVVLTSCSKEHKLNKNLDGTWDVVSYTLYGIVITPASAGYTSYTYKFTKGKKGLGSFIRTMVKPSITTVDNGSYVLTEDTKIALTFENGTISSDLVSSYSKTDLTVVDSNGNTWVLKKQ